MYRRIQLDLCNIIEITKHGVGGFFLGVGGLSIFILKLDAKRPFEDIFHL